MEFLPIINVLNVRSPLRGLKCLINSHNRIIEQKVAEFGARADKAFKNSAKLRGMQHRNKE